MKLNNVDFDTYFKNYPTNDGYFGKYGGAYIPEELKAAMVEIRDAYQTICKSAKFIAELRRIRKDFQGRPTPVSHLDRLSQSLGNGVQLYVKREDLNHTGAHKLNHCMGEALLAKYMGKKKVIAETGAGQHGVALATAAAYFGLECDIYMGSVDIKKQAPNVARMKILGARVIEVTDGLATLKEAVDAAFAAYSVSYILCREYGVDASGYDFSRLPDSFRESDAQGVRAALSEIRDTAGNISSRMSRALEQNRQPKSKEQER